MADIDRLCNIGTDGQYRSGLILGIPVTGINYIEFDRKCIWIKARLQPLNNIPVVVVTASRIGLKIASYISSLAVVIAHAIIACI
jgi:hypothetical protein